MIAVNKLRGRIIEKGYTQAEVAEMIGMTPKTFGTKLKQGVFSSDEIEALIEILSISDPMSIFFVSNK